MLSPRPRIALAVSGDASDPALFSGTTASVLGALRGLDLDVTTLSNELPAALQRSLINLLVLGFLEPGRLIEGLRGEGIRLAIRAHKPRLHASRELMLLRSQVVGRRLAGAGNVARVVQWGSEYHLPPATDYVTLDDATIVQLRRSYPYPWMQEVPEGALHRMMDRQRRIFREARACCVFSHWAARSVREDYGVAAERVRVLGTGANRALSPRPRDWSQPRFLFVGLDFRRKNGPRVLDVFAQLRRSFPQATLDVVGRHPPIDLPGVRGHGVLALGHPEESQRLDALFARCTCFVMPSLIEPMGHVHAEALAAGVGAVGTTHGGPALTIADSGRVVDPEDDGAILAAMLEFCDPDVARRFGERAAARAPLFTWTAVAQRIVRALELPGVDLSGYADFL